MILLNSKRSLKEKIKKASLESLYEASLIINAFKNKNINKNLNWHEFYTPDMLEVCASLKEKGILNHSVAIECLMPFCELNVPDKISNSLTLQSSVVWRDEAGRIDNPTGAAIITPMNVLIFAKHGVLGSPITNGPAIANFEENLASLKVKIKFDGFQETPMSIKMLWCSQGDIHNSNGPAIITSDGLLIYVNRGKIHNENDFAIKPFDVNSLVQKGNSGEIEDKGFRFNNGEMEKTPAEG